MPIQTILEADEFFASLPDGPDAVADFAARRGLLHRAV